MISMTLFCPIKLSFDLIGREKSFVNIIQMESPIGIGGANGLGEEYSKEQ